MLRLTGRMALLLGCAALAWCGCTPPPAKEPPSPTAESPSPTAEATSLAPALPEGETWDIYRMQGARIGYGRTVVRHGTDADGPAVTIESLLHMQLQRYGEATEQEIRASVTETRDGHLRRFQSEIQQGPTPQRTTGEVHGNRLEMELSTASKKTRFAIPWSPQYGGPNASEESWLQAPMKPGEHRKIQAFELLGNQVVVTEMTARDYEQVPLLVGTFSLLHIDTVMRLADGQKLAGVSWTDRNGAVLKCRVEPNMEVIRAPKEVATAKVELGTFDLNRSLRIKVDRPLPHVHDGRRVRYRITLEGGNPAEVFPAGISQKVVPIDAQRAEVTVYPIRPGSAGNESAHEDPPTDAQRQPNNFLQSDDAKVVADAHEAAGRETDPWRVALALERYVFQAIRRKDYSQAFATAAEVARSREGDCKMHAVYLAAMARALGIPSRVAIGLVYLSSTQSFDYHMWTELYIDGRWIGLDGTMAKGGIGGGHLKLADSSFDGVAAYSSFLPVMKVLGRLRVEVLEIK